MLQQNQAALQRKKKAGQLALKPWRSLSVLRAKQPNCMCCLDAHYHCKHASDQRLLQKRRSNAKLADHIHTSTVGGEVTDRKRRRCHTGCTHHSLALGCCSCQIETQQETPRKSDERRTQPQPVLLTRCIWPKLSYASAMDVTAANCIASFPIDHQSCRAHKPRRRALHRTEGLDLRAAGPRPQPRRTAFSRFTGMPPALHSPLDSAFPDRILGRRRNASHSGNATAG